jgi:hypothetical protein
MGMVLPDRTVAVHFQTEILIAIAWMNMAKIGSTRTLLP